MTKATICMLAAAGALAACGAKKGTTLPPDVGESRVAPTTPVFESAGESAGERGGVEAGARPGFGFVAQVVEIDPTLSSICGLAEESKAYFPLDSAELVGEKATLERLAACLRDGPLEGKRVAVVGHADPRGSEAYNLRLGRERAENTASFMTGLGVSPEQIDVFSLGEETATGDDPRSWALDRHVTIRLLDRP